MEHLVVCLLVTSIVFGAVSGASINRTKEDEIKRNIQDFKAFVQAIEDNMVHVNSSFDKKETSRGKKFMLETDIPVQPAQVEQTINVEFIQNRVQDANVQKAVSINIVVEAEKDNDDGEKQNATTQTVVVVQDNNDPSKNTAASSQTEDNKAETNEASDPASKQQFPLLAQAQNFIQNIVRPLSTVPPSDQEILTSTPPTILAQVEDAVSLVISTTIQNFQISLHPDNIIPPAFHNPQWQGPRNKTNIIELIKTQFQSVAQNVQTEIKNEIQNGIQNGLQNFQNAIGVTNPP